MLQRIVTAVNALSSQAWAFTLVILGMGTFGMACVCTSSDVRAALMSSGTGMIGGGIAMFSHSTGNTPQAGSDPKAPAPVAPITPAA